MRLIEKKPLRSYAEYTPNGWYTVYVYDCWGCFGAIASTVGTGLAAWALFAVPDPTFVTKFLGWTTTMAAVAQAGIALRVCFRW